MFKKELREIWKPVLLRFSVVLAFPLFFLVQAILTSKMNSAHAAGFILIPFSVVMIWIANFLGVTAFKAEYEDRALEYWLTFPYGMLGIMARKMASRIALVLLMAIIYAGLFIFPVINKTDKISPVSLGLFAVLFFINGCLCGFLVNRNLRMVANVVTFFSFVALSLGLSRITHLLFPEGNQLSAAVSSISAFLLVIGIMGGTFFFSARKFDLRSPDLFMKRVRTVCLPLILVLAIAALIFRYSGGRT